MGLIELSLLSLPLLSPQAPTTEPAEPAAVAGPAHLADEAPVAGAAASEPSDADDPQARLAAAEQAGAAADPKELASLSCCDHEAIAARAAWLLARGDLRGKRDELVHVVQTSPHAEARVQALQALRQTAHPELLPVATAAMSDGNRRVRTIATQLIGKLRRSSSIDKLLALVDTASKSEEPGPATDVQAAILTLTDLKCADHLLRIATAVRDGTVESTGNALAYAFQTLSPTLEADRESTVLVAVLDHPEALLRRYAIMRLTELGTKTAAAALEGRLAAEGPELRPLIEVALAQLRFDGAGGQQSELERAKTNAMALLQKAKAWWQAQPPIRRGIAVAVPVLLLIAFCVWMRSRRNRRRAEDALAVTAMVAPSDEYLEEQEAAYEYEDGEDDDEEYDDGYDSDDEGVEYEDDGEYEDEYDNQNGDYDTSGWDEDDSEEVTADSADDHQYR